MTQHIVNHPDFNDLDEVRRSAQERCDDIAVQLWGKPQIHDRREMRWGRHGSRSVALAGDRRGLWYDHENGEGGDVFDLVMREVGGGFEAAVLWLRRALALPARTESNTVEVLPPVDQASRIGAALNCFRAGRCADGPGRAYFNGRGLDWLPAVARQMRWGEKVWLKGHGMRECLLMPVRDDVSGEICGVHKIALDSFCGGKRVKQSNGRIKGGAMRLVAAGEGLAVCEGLETAVGAIMAGVNEGYPVWALCGASFLSVFGPVEGVKHLIVMADNDAPGRRAAGRCAGLWERVVVDIVWPDEPGTDFADRWRV